MTSRRWELVTVALFAAAGGSLFTHLLTTPTRDAVAALQEKPAKVVRAGKFVLVDEKGKTRWSVEADGYETLMQVCNAKGIGVVDLSVQADGEKAKWTMMAPKNHIGIHGGVPPESYVWSVFTSKGSVITELSHMKSRRSIRSAVFGKGNPAVSIQGDDDKKIWKSND